jgi:hypothetical protein
LSLTVLKDFLSSDIQKPWAQICISFKYILRKVDYIMFTFEPGTRINEKEKAHAFMLSLDSASSQKEAEERLEYMSYFYSHFKCGEFFLKPF